MSGFNGRQYIANLNAIPSAADLAAAQQQDNLGVGEDLSKYRIDEFFDIDMGERAEPLNAAAYPFNDFPGFQDMLNDDNAIVGDQAIPTDPFAAATHGVPASSTTTSPATPFDSVNYGNLTDSTPTSHPSDSLEEKSRQLAEEDKRRRNTAASARFRVKKKQREQDLEKRVKEQTDKNTQLETVISQLRMENKWLKNLVTEKNENKGEVAELWRKFHKDGSDTSSTVERKDGVGTVVKADDPVE